MKKVLICFFLLVSNYLYSNVEQDTTSLTNKYAHFSPNLSEFFKDSKTLENQKEFVLENTVNNDIVYDGYGYITTIEKENDTTFNFYLKMYFSNKKGELKLKEVSKYCLELKNNYYVIQIDTSYNSFSKISKKEINDIKKKYNSLKAKETEQYSMEIDNDIKPLIENLALGSLGRNKEAIEMFQGLRKNFQMYLINVTGYKYNQYERILADYGYIKDPNSTADYPRIYKREYYYY